MPPNESNLKREQRLTFHTQAGSSSPKYLNSHKNHWKHRSTYTVLVCTLVDSHPLYQSGLRHCICNKLHLLFVLLNAAYGCSCDSTVSQFVDFCCGTRSKSSGEDWHRCHRLTWENHQLSLGCQKSHWQKCSSSSAYLEKGPKWNDLYLNNRWIWNRRFFQVNSQPR